MLIYAQAKRRKGLSNVELLLTFSLVTSIAVVTMPMLVRTFKGYFFSQSRKLDRQFDPKDRSVENRSSTSGSSQTIDSSYFAVMRAPIYWPTLSSSQSTTGGMDFQLELPEGFPMLVEGFPNSMYTTSSGTSASDYEYCDEIQGVCP